MADWPLHAGGNLTETVGIVAATTTGTSVTGSATAHTKGAYAQLVAATGYEWSGFILSVWHPSAGDRILLDLAIGAAASEQVILPNLFLQTGADTTPVLEEIFIPLLVPKGVRVSARLQSANGASVIYRVAIRGLPSHTRMLVPFGVATDYGPNLGATDAVTVDPGGTANTKGAYAQIVASTSRALRALQLQVVNATPDSVSMRWLMDVAIGAAASEQIVMPDIPVHSPDFGHGCSRVRIPMPVDIPSGTRIAVRAQGTGIVAADRILKVAVMGYDG